MSAALEASQHPNKRASTAWRALSWLLRLCLLLPLLAVLGTAILAWRLAQGPLDVLWLARRVEANILPQAGPAHLAIGSATIAWNGFNAGADGALQLHLRDVRLVDHSGTTDASLASLDASLSALRLLEASVAPRSIVLEGLRLGATRAADGTLRLQLGGLDDHPSPDAPTLPAILAELRNPAHGDQHRGSPGLRVLAQLQHVRIDDADLRIHDLAPGRTLDAQLARLDLRRQPGGGVDGAADGKVSLGTATASLRLAADLLPGGGTHLAATLAPLKAATIAGTDPALAPLAALDAAMGARASLDLAPDLSPRTGTLHVGADGGVLALPGAGIPFDRLVLDATAAWSGGTWRPTAISIQRALAVVGSASGAWSTTVAATAQATRSDGNLQVAIDVSLDHLAVADLAKLWPIGLAPHVRPWLTENLTAGTLRNGTAKLTLAAPEADPTNVTIAKATGALDGEDVTIHWLRPAPPVEHVKAHLSFTNPDEVDLAVQSGSQGPLTLEDGTIKFTSLQEKDQDMALAATLHGPVPDALHLLANPRLQLLSKHPMPIKSSDGTVAARLTVAMPMKHDVRVDQIKIHALGKLSNLLLGGIVAGRNLDHGDLTFDVDQDGLQANGTAHIAGIPATVAHQMDFRGGPPTQVLQRSSATGRATVAQLIAAGIDPGGAVAGGQVGLSAAYTALRNRSATVDLDADFKDAAMVLAGWSKPAGPAATGSARLLLQDDRLQGIRQIQALGPNLRIVGVANMVGTRPLLLELSVIELGATRAAGTIRLPARPGDPISASLRGSTLDLSTEIAGKPSPGSATGPWTADVHFDRVVLVHGHSFADVTGRVEDDGTRLRALDVTAGGREQLRAVIVPQGSERRISVRADDAGAVLQALDVTTAITGGKLSLEGTFDDRKSYSPLSGTLDLTDFAVHDAVAVGKLLQAVTVYGLFDAMRGTGVQFARLYLPFRYDRRQIHVGEARAFSSSLGLTARGWIDLARKQMDIRGTLVPAYAINSALGRIPLIGRLFSPETGGGLVAVNYSVTGNAADPAVTVNPLSALTPGFLRGVFAIFK